MVGLKYYSKLEFILSPEKVRVKKDIFVLNDFKFLQGTSSSSKSHLNHIMSIMCRFFRKGAILFIVEGRDKN
jgi:hypothetical protein